MTNHEVWGQQKIETWVCQTNNFYYLSSCFALAWQLWGGPPFPPPNTHDSTASAEDGHAENAVEGDFHCAPVSVPHARLLRGSVINLWVNVSRMVLKISSCSTDVG